MTNIKPWYNMFPHSNYSQFNLDWLISKYGEYDQRIKTVEDAVADHETRLQTAEADIDSLEGRMDSAEDRLTSAEGRITSAEGRITVNEGNITAIFNKLNTDESDISDLKTRMTSAETSITDLSGRMTAAEGEINTLQSDVVRIDQKDQAQDNDIAALDSRVTALEEEDAVIANPGGTGPLLNSVSISGTTYTIDNSGGGGGGSSVTPNPAGTPTATLESVDVDGTIYGMPISSAQVSQLNTNIHNLQVEVAGIDNTVDEINTWEAGDNSPVDPGHFNMEATGNVQTLDDTLFTLDTPGLYLINAHTEINTTNYGSTPRYLGFYTRVVGGHDNSGDPWGSFNLQLDKFSIRGDEPAMITQAASMSNVTLLRVISGEEYQIKLAVRCNATNNQRFSGDYWFDCIRLK